MTKPPSTARRNLRGGVACISIVALLVPPPLLAAAPVVERDRATPATTVDREQLESLQGTRSVADLLKVCPARTIPTVTRGPQAGDSGSSATGLNCIQPDDLRVIDIYKAHNDARALFGSQPLAWDPQLAAQAASYGPDLAKYGRPVHSSRVGRETSRENLLQALPGTSPQNMVNVWISERQYFVPGTFPNVSSTGNWADVGHFTQMVWPTTTNLGCAIHNGGQFDWLICRYSPPGNRDGSAIGLPPTIIAQSPVININNPAPAASPPPRQPAQAAPVDPNICRVADPDDLRQLLADAAAKSGFAPESPDPRDSQTDRQWNLALQREQEVQDRLITELARLQGDVAKGINTYLAASSAWQERYLYISSTTTGLQGLLTNWLEAREVYEKADLAFALMNLGVGGVRLGMKAYRFLAARRATATAEAAQATAAATTGARAGEAGAAATGARTGEAGAAAMGETQAFNRTLIPPGQSPNVPHMAGYAENALQAARTRYIRDVERTRQALRQAEQAGDNVSAELFRTALDDLVKAGIPTTAPAVPAALSRASRISPEVAKLADEAGVNAEAIAAKMIGKADDLLEWEVLRAVAKARGWHDVPGWATQGITNALIEARKVLGGVEGARISPQNVELLKSLKTYVESRGQNFANWLRTAAGESAFGAEQVMEVAGAKIVKKYEVIEGIVRYYDDVDINLILKIIDTSGDAAALRNAVSPVAQASLNGLAHAAAVQGACGALDAGLKLESGSEPQKAPPPGGRPTDAQLANVLEGTGQLGQVGLGNVVDQFGITDRFAAGQGLGRAILGELWELITSPSATTASFYYTNEAQKEYLNLLQNEQGKLVELGTTLDAASRALADLQRTLQRAGLSGPASYLGARGPADLRRALDELQRVYNSGSDEWKRRHKDQMDERRAHITQKLADLQETVNDLNALAGRMQQVRNWLDSLRLTPEGKLRGPVEAFNPLTFVRLGSIALYLRGMGADMFGLTNDVPFRVSVPQMQTASAPPAEDWDAMRERLRAQAAALNAAAEVEVDPGLDAWLNSLDAGK